MLFVELSVIYWGDYTQMGRRLSAINLKQPHIETETGKETVRQRRKCKNFPFFLKKVLLQQIDYGIAPKSKTCE